MRFTLTPEQERFRQQVRAWLAEAVTAELRQELAATPGEVSGPETRRFYRELGERGWLRIFWPKEYGGPGLSAVEQLIFLHELERAGAPPLSLTVTSIVPTLLRVGTEEQKRRWLPRIISGEVDFALGYSEPEAGSDLASLKTRATLQGDEYVIHGQKIWNSYAHTATHNWLACRTDPDAPKHQGISIIIVPMDLPGIAVQPIATWGDLRTNVTYFDGVRVPRENLVGEPNRGWEYMMMALDFERHVIQCPGSNEVLLEKLVAYCRETVIDGERLADRPEVRWELARLAVEVGVHRLLAYHTAWLVDQGKVPTREASQVKVFGSELYQRIADAGMRICQLYGQLAPPSAEAPLRGELERAYRLSPVKRFAGGTNEIQRDIIATRGLGLPLAR